MKFSLFATAALAVPTAAEIYLKEQFNDDVSIDFANVASYLCEPWSFP